MLATAYLSSDQLSLTPPCGGTDYFFAFDALGDTSPGIDDWRKDAHVQFNRWSKVQDWRLELSTKLFQS